VSNGLDFNWGLLYTTAPHHIALIQHYPLPIHKVDVRYTFRQHVPSPRYVSCPLLGAETNVDDSFCDLGYITMDNKTLGMNYSVFGNLSALVSCGHR
jgi:hypothetical protein